MTNDQKHYIEWLEDTLEQAGFFSNEDIEEAINNLLKVFNVK